MREAKVRCTALSKSFPSAAGAGALTATTNVVAVHDVHLLVHAGEILALLGPSGCGKTTTMRLIAGFERPDGGRIEVGGQVVADANISLPPERRKVGMVFQNFALFPHMTVAENIAYGLGRKEDKRTRVREMLALVDLAGVERRFPHQLSGGQQQRIALARALAPRPEVLLLDEPFSGLDAALRDQVRTEVLAILRASGATVILVTHNQDEALHFGDHIAVMNAGQIEQVGLAKSLFLAPATRFVAGFLGTTSFLEGLVTEEGLQTELGLWTQATALPAGTRVDVVVRPDDLTVEVDSSGPAQIVSALFRGETYLYEVALPSGNRIRCEGNHATLHPLGAPVRVRLTPGHPLACFVRAGE